MTESALAAVARAAAEQQDLPQKQPAVITTPAGSSAGEPDTAALTAAHQDGMTAGIQAERTRCKAILTAEAAKDRGNLAHYFAFDTDMSAEQAVAALDMAPKAEAADNPFLSAMRSEPTPSLGTGAAAGTPASPTMTLAERAAARHGVPTNASR